jgi:hypothetical protein
MAKKSLKKNKSAARSKKLTAGRPLRKVENLKSVQKVRE